jgi:hypothetical protein
MAFCADAAAASHLAICWDQVNYQNPDTAGPWCTYKDLVQTDCTGGPHVGAMYVCNQPP